MGEKEEAKIDVEQLSTLLGKQMCLPNSKAYQFAKDAFAYCDNDKSGFIEGEEVDNAIRYIKKKMKVSDANQALKVRD